MQTSQIGCLIGKGGSIIKQIRGETGATDARLAVERAPRVRPVDDELLEIGQWPADACALGIRIVSPRASFARRACGARAAERMSAAKPAAPTSSPASPSPPPPPRLGNKPSSCPSE